LKISSKSLTILKTNEIFLVFNTSNFKAEPIDPRNNPEIISEGSESVSIRNFAISILSSLFNLYSILEPLFLSFGLDFLKAFSAI